jgi:tetratricopeptide (TPR) repeat protein
MNSRQRVGWIVGVAVVAALGLGWGVWQLGTRFGELTLRTQQQAKLAAKAARTMQVKKGQRFTNDEVYTFLAAAKQAERIKDPLQRCLAYPDPPHSHWLPAAVQAYCQFRMQPLMSFADMQTLIQNGRSGELDKRMAQLLDAQMTQPNSRGVLDRTFEQDFDGSFDVRQTLDAWKRDSPNSAFALAASGYAYEKMALKARGGGYISNTPQSNVDAMDRLLQQADGDLQQAVALNPHIAPAWAAMVEAGGLSLGNAYARDAQKRGLASNPTDFSIYSNLLWLSQPKWGGSIQAMNDIAADAQKHAAENPLLVLELSKAPAYEKLDDCDCHSADELATYPVIFDQVSTSQLLAKAGTAAASSHHLELAAVYLSEALRFEPSLSDARFQRIAALTNFDESQWAVEEASRLVDASPDDAENLRARGWAYESLGDYARATQDYERALALNPSDPWPLMEMGSIYGYSTHEWSKAWDVSTRLIQSYPNAPAGWLLRAEVQKDQPRAGLKDTVEQFASRFGSDPAQLKNLTLLRAKLALQQGAASHAASAKASNP